MTRGARRGRSALRGVAWSALVAAAFAACRVGGPPPVVRAALPDEEPPVRVGIAVDAEAVTVGSTARFEIGEPGRDPAVRAEAGERWTFTADAAGRLVARRSDGRRIGPFTGPVRIRVRDDDAPVLIDGEPYRGGALLRAAGAGRVTAINVLALEDYLLGVVPMEIGPRPAEEIEAVKAQAVAARTYAISHLGGRESLGFDFYATVADQVYGGVSREHDVVSRAVRETRGEIVTYRGSPILAYYHSTCGGRTAAIDEAWRHAPLPYLKSVSDRVEGGDGAYYCDISNRFRWTEHWTGERLREILTRTLADRMGTSAPIREIEEIEVTGHTASGRVRALRIVADGREYLITPPDSTRRVLRPEAGRLLNSALFVLDVEREDGEVTGVTASGGGWGHGIGMCQMGAIGRARAGQDYRQILATYYRDTEITRLY
ncbi:MAG TPA: SpoIID/LytB domain-containing protein [Longimicrobiales bacterium]